MTQAEFERRTEQFVKLCEPDDDRQKDILLALLKDAEIPAYYRDNGAGSYVRIMTGGSVFGSSIFVPISCQTKAQELLFSVQQKAEFSQEALEAAYEEYMQENPIFDEAEAPQDGGKGYRLFQYFFIGFSVLIAGALLYLFIK